MSEPSKRYRYKFVEPPLLIRSVILKAYRELKEEWEGVNSPIRSKLKFIADCTDRSEIDYQTDTRIRGVCKDNGTILLAKKKAKTMLQTLFHEYRHLLHFQYLAEKDEITKAEKYQLDLIFEEDAEEWGNAQYYLFYGKNYNLVEDAEKQSLKWLQSDREDTIYNESIYEPTGNFMKSEKLAKEWFNEIQRIKNN